MAQTKELDLSYLDTLLGTYEGDLDAKLFKDLAEDNFTYAMYRAGFLAPVTDENGVITGFDFQPPQNFDMLMTGTSGADTLAAGDGDDVINAGDGDDTVEAGAGNDFLYGGDGNDSLYGGLGDDRLEGGEGDDAIDGQDGFDTLLVDGNVGDFSFNFIDSTSFEITDTNSILGTDTVSNIEQFDFNDGSFTRTELEALFSGPNEITGTSGNDTLYGTAGDDLISGLAGLDTLHGGDGNDTLYGGADHDTLYGENGDDILNGGDGLNFLYGGTGADTFEFSAGEAFSGVDRVTDFNSAEGDVLDISDILTAYDPTMGDVLEDFVEVTDNGTDTFIAIDTNGGGDSFSTIAKVWNTTEFSDVQAAADAGILVV